MNKLEQKQQLNDLVAQNDRLRGELVQLARFGAKGDSERLRIQVLRLIRSLRAEGDALADLLQAAVFGRDDAPSAQATRSVRMPPTRSISHPVPVDGESRLDLLRVEDPPVMPHPLVQSAAVMRRLEQLITERRSISRLAKANLQPSKTVLFTGPPGVGKTLAARHLALELQLPLLVLDLASVISSYLGRTGNNIKQAFDFARKRKCVFFLDEIDAVAKRRDDDSDVGELKRLVTVLLQEIDLWGSDNLLVAATNHASLLDTAVWRRFDSAVEFPAPSAHELERLGNFVTTPGDPVTAGWKKVLALVSAGGSQSDYMRDLNRLRRSLLLNGKKHGMSVLEEIVAARTGDLKVADRKLVAVSLVTDAGISQREASKLSRVARETLRSALQE